jgi:hypothetical protein
MVPTASSTSLPIINSPTMLAHYISLMFRVWTKIWASQLLCLLPAPRCFLARLIAGISTWKRHNPPKHQLIFNRPCSIISHMIGLFKQYIILQMVENNFGDTLNQDLQNLILSIRIVVVCTESLWTPSFLRQEASWIPPPVLSISLCHGNPDRQ